MGISKEHHALLVACTTDSTNFEPALRKWEIVQNIGDIDFATMRLIPFLYRRAQLLGVKMANEGICKGLYLRAWYLLKTTGVPSLDWVSKQKCFSGAIVLKGAALQKTIYADDPPTRPADDLDLLIPRESALEVFGVLERAGLSMDHGLSPRTITNLRNGINFYGEGMAIDVHWNLFPVSLDPTFIRRIFHRSVPLVGILRTLSPTDHLLHTLLHGFGANDIAPIRWALDAALLIREKEIDWGLFWREVSANGWGRIFKKQLTVLRSLDLLVPGPQSVKFSFSLPMFVSQILMRSTGLWSRRAFRILGFDYAAWSLNTSRRISFLQYLTSSPKWIPLVANEWREFREHSTMSISSLRRLP